MAKYSTDRGGGDGGGDSCELCGRETSGLQRASVAGADLLVCSDCAPHGEAATDDRSGRASDDGDDEPSRGKRAAQAAARVYDASRGDSEHWEREGTDYEDDRLPYLVSAYGERAAEARRDAGVTVEELAADLGVDEETLLAVEQGRAARADVGGSVIRALEESLDVSLAED